MESIEQSRVMTTELNGVQTKALNQAVRRNKDRFPSDFMFRLTKDEKKEVVTNCDHLHMGEIWRYLSWRVHGR